MMSYRLVMRHKNSDTKKLKDKETAKTALRLKKLNYALTVIVVIEAIQVIRAMRRLRDPRDPNHPKDPSDSSETSWALMRPKKSEMLYTNKFRSSDDENETPVQSNVCTVVLCYRKQF